MATDADAEKIKNILLDVWGIRSVDISLKRGEAVLTFNDDAASFIDFEQAVADCGFHIENPEGAIKQNEW